MLFLIPNWRILLLLGCAAALPAQAQQVRVAKAAHGQKAAQDQLARQIIAELAPEQAKVAEDQYLAQRKSPQLRVLRKADTTPFEVPRTFGFDTEEEFNNNFTLVDANDDNTCWLYNAEASNNVPANRAYIGYNATNGLDDYLITSAPAMLPAGDNHMTMVYKGRSAWYPEKFEVLYGTSNDPAQMTSLGEVTVQSNADQTFLGQFTLAEAGNYYFAIHAMSAPDMFGFSIDDLTISSGKYIGVADLRVNRVILSDPSNVLAQEPVAIEVSNRGEDIATSFVATTTVDGGNAQTETIGLPTGIEPGETFTYTLENLVDLSAPGAHTVQVVLSGVVSEQGRTDEDESNNTASATTYKMGEFDIPFNADFTTERNLDKWASSGDFTWRESNNSYDQSMILAGGSNAKIMSAGVRLQAGKTYRMSTSMVAGMILYGYTYTGSFKVAMGEPGTDSDNWTTLCERNEIIYETFTDDEFTFSVPASGTYQFMIVATENGGTVEYKYWNVEELLPYELRVTSVQNATMLPVEQAAQFPTSIAYVNRGEQAASFTFKVMEGDNTLGTAQVADVASSAAGNVAVATVPVSPAAGQVLSLALDASVDNQPDAAVTVPAMHDVAITDSIFALDQVTDDMLTSDLAIGNSDAVVGMGQYFTLSVADVLTGVQVLWASDLEASGDIRVFAINADGSVGDEVVSATYEKQPAAGAQNFALQPVRLNAGSYLAFVYAQGYVFSADQVPGGAIFTHTNNNFGVQTDLGNPGVRLILGVPADAAADVAVTEITRPNGKAVYSANEPVVAQLANYGSSDVETLVTLSVDGTEVASQTVALSAFESSSVTLTADLTAVGVHTLVVAAALDGDTNPDNNSATVEVESMERPADNVLDFEACEDFSIDVLVPSWTMIDGDQTNTYGFSNFTFPHISGPKAFIVMNLSQIEGVNEETAAALAPYQGEKYGASFAPVSGAADDWLISPKLSISDDATLTFAARSYTTNYGAETYRVLVSENGTDPSDFVEVQGSTEVPAEWVEQTVSLAEYAGKNVHVAIQHDTEDTFIFMIDDIKVNGVVSSVSDVDASKAVASVRYYNLAGQECVDAQQGVTIVVTTYTDGTRTATKRIVK